MRTPFVLLFRPIRLAVLLTFVTSAAMAAELKLLLPQARTAFQTNEVIDVSVVRHSADKPLDQGTLSLALACDDGSRLAYEFAVPGAALGEGGARRTEHAHFNGGLLRPGHYVIEATADGVNAKTEIDVYSHIRRSEFKLINWGKAKGAGQLAQGEDSLGYNLMYMHYGAEENANYIRAGVDFMSNCTMSGAHQMDIRMECDWSDPYVTKGGTMRVVRRAMQDRTKPHCAGVHFYDEPGLTWWKDPETGQFGPHMVPGQVKSFVSAFGREPLRSHKIDANNPDHVAQWNHWARWKLGIMDAAWKEAQLGVSRVRPDFLSVTQSQYGWSAFTDGYYFNVARSLPVTSGHGGYHDYGPGYFNPIYTLELARARDWSKPCWYLPTWYGNTTDDQYRLEQNLSFMTGLQGMVSPPDLEPAENPSARQAIVETNLLYQKLGPIFNTITPTKPPVALLYSLSQAIHAQTKNMQDNYVHAIPHGKNLPLTYLAGKLIQHQFLPIVEEDILDGTLASDHKAIVLTSLDYLAPEIIRELERFAAGGGLVLMTADCTVTINGAINLGVTPAMPDQAKIDELMKTQKYGELGPFTTTTKHFEAALPIGKACQTELEKRGIHAPLKSDQPGIIVTRHVAGDVEYLFAVNATPDADARDAQGNPDKITPKAVVARLSFPGQRVVYDAVQDQLLFPNLLAAAHPTYEFRFGPGQMRVFAVTREPIVTMRLAQPRVVIAPLNLRQPARVDFGIQAMFAHHQPVGGSVPLLVRVIDPLGVERHRVHRATSVGQLALSLPLAANDPAGEWTVTVEDHITGKPLTPEHGNTATFQYAPVRTRTLSGLTHRAVALPDDIQRAFEFSRKFADVTIVCGSSPFNAAAAERLTKALAPWGVRCKQMPLAEAAKSKSLTEDEARTWVGLQYAASGQIKPGDGNPPQLAGFAVQGPVILIGNPDDHAILKYLLAEKYLPYEPKPHEFPGRGRGMIAWQLDGLGRGQESIALIAHDEEGMSEAVGTFYEAVAGLESLTRWTLPTSDAITPASKPVGMHRSGQSVWTAALPDRVLGFKIEGDSLVAISHDGSASTLNAKGEVTSSKEADPAELALLRKPLATPFANPAGPIKHPERLVVKHTVANADLTAFSYWGGTLRVINATGETLIQQRLPQDVTALTWWNGRVIAGLADGRIVALKM